MLKKMVVLCCFLFVVTGCGNSSPELNDMKSLVQQQQGLIKEYQKQLSELDDFKKKVKTLQSIFTGVLERLDKLDESMYQGRYVVAPREQKVSPENSIAGYVDLINQVEKDLAEKRNK